MAAARRPQFGYSFAQGPVAELVDAPDLKANKNNNKTIKTLAKTSQ
jgi:hypothetical protein